MDIVDAQASGFNRNECFQLSLPTLEQQPDSKPRKVPAALNVVWQAVVSALASDFLLRWQLPVSLSVLLVAVLSLLWTQETPTPPPDESAPAVAMILPVAAPAALPATAPASPSVIAAPAVAQPLPELADKPEPLVEAMVRQQEIEQLLNSWTTAWQQQDLDAYFAAYSAAFEPANGEDRGRWQRDRTRTIGKARNIRIQWHDLSWTSAADAAATAEIWLDYQAAGYGDSTRKQLLLRRQDGSLRILFAAAG